MASRIYAVGGLISVILLLLTSSCIGEGTTPTLHPCEMVPEDKDLCYKYFEAEKDPCFQDLLAGAANPRCGTLANVPMSNYGAGDLDGKCPSGCIIPKPG